MANYTTFIWALISAWGVFSTYYIIRMFTLGSRRVYMYVYESIPSVFTTLGVLGTFMGIFFGLQEFDVDKITESIPPLLEGMKTAFLTSIVGISLSIVFGKVSQIILRDKELKEPAEATGELEALQQIATLLREGQKINNQHFETLTKSIASDKDDSVSTQLVKLRNVVGEQSVMSVKQNGLLERISQALGGDDETSLLTQMQKLRVEQNENANETRKNVEWIVDSMNANNKLIQEKFDEFSQLLAKNNTEALVDVMKRATQEFNAQMSTLIEKLVQENFQELNNSVQRMNDWQMENKEMISTLTSQFRQVSADFSIASDSIKEVVMNTSKLTDENSHLTKLIRELQQVLIEDEKFKSIVDKLDGTVETLKENTDAFDETTNKLNQWVKNQMNFSDSVTKLLVRLEEIDKIKDINEVFWKNTEKQLNEGVTVIQKESQVLSADLESINAEFYERLNSTLQNLDNLIQRIIANYENA